MKFHESSRYSSGSEQRVVLVDIDETICFYADCRRYDLAEPNHDYIKKINKLYDEGWKVVYWTARGAKSGVDYYDYTMSQLKSWNCKFHELTTGTSTYPKPSFDLVIDDKAKRIEEL